MVELLAKKMAFVFVLMSLVSCSAGYDMSLTNRSSLISNHPLGMNEVRKVRVRQLNDIILVVHDSQESELLLRIGQSLSARLDVRVECSRFRRGYYFGRTAEENINIELKAYWYGFKYRKYNDGVTYSRVGFEVMPYGKIRIKLHALLKEIATGKLLLVAPSVIDVPSQAFIESLSHCQ